MRLRRRTLLVVAALLAAVLLALGGPGAAMAAAASTTSFKGKPSVYYRGSAAYFVVNFTCSGGTLSGNWTWEDTGAVSRSGTLGVASCALGPGSVAGSWSSSIGAIPLSYQGNPTGATLHLALSNVASAKTYVAETTTCPSDTSLPCIVITTSGLGAAVGSRDADFNSVTGSPSAYGTLNLTLPRS